MFELHVADVNVTGGSLPVSWCIDAELLKYLSDNNVKDPLVVIVTAPVGEGNYAEHKESRKIVPLKDLLAYVNFRASGKNRIWAFISQKSLKGAKKSYLSKMDGTYDSTLLENDGEEFYEYFFSDKSNKELLSAPYVEVDVPAECFAPEPSKFDKAWVNHFFRQKPADQCEYRRRRIFAYVVQPVVMLFNVALRFVFTLISLLFGARTFSFKPLMYPLRYSITDGTINLVDLTKGSVFIRQFDHEGKLFSENPFSFLLKKFCLLPFMPAVLIPFLLLQRLKGTLFVSSIIGGVMLATAIVLFVVLGGYEPIWNRINKLFSNTNEEAWYLNKEEMDLIVCNGDKKIRTFTDLPPKKKTLKLRYLDLKSKVCKPFSA